MTSARQKSLENQQQRSFHSACPSHLISRFLLADVVDLGLIESRGPAAGLSGLMTARLSDYRYRRQGFAFHFLY